MRKLLYLLYKKFRSRLGLALGLLLHNYWTQFLLRCWCWDSLKRFLLPSCRCGSKTAVPSAGSSSSRALGSQSLARPRRRHLQPERPHLSPVPARTVPTARHHLHRALPSHPAPTVPVPLCPSGAQPPFRPCRTPSRPPAPPACNAPPPILWPTPKLQPTPRAMPAPPVTSPAWTVARICPLCILSWPPLGELSAPSQPPPWVGPSASLQPPSPPRATPRPSALAPSTVWTTRTRRLGSSTSTRLTAWTTRTRIPGSSRCCSRTTARGQGLKEKGNFRRTKYELSGHTRVFNVSNVRFLTWTTIPFIAYHNKKKTDAQVSDIFINLMDIIMNAEVNMHIHNKCSDSNKDSVSYHETYWVLQKLIVWLGESKKKKITAELSYVIVL